MLDKPCMNIWICKSSVKSGCRVSSKLRQCNVSHINVIVAVKTALIRLRNAFAHAVFSGFDSQKIFLILRPQENARQTEFYSRSIIGILPSMTTLLNNKIEFEQKKMRFSLKLYQLFNPLLNNCQNHPGTSQCS